MCENVCILTLWIDDRVVNLILDFLKLYQPYFLEGYLTLTVVFLRFQILANSNSRLSRFFIFLLTLTFVFLHFQNWANSNYRLSCFSLKS